MRLKSTSLSCAFAWAPSSLGTPTFLATASLAGAMDDCFSTEAFLEIRLVDVTRTDETDMPIVGRTVIPERAFRVDWCSFGGPCGMIAVACNNGAVYVYDADVIMKNHQSSSGRASADPLLSTIFQHRGAVRGCQFNPSQTNFLAIGADDGEWDVWTLEDPRDPQRVPVMSNAAHTSAIVHLQWHPKYPHIIATASANSVVNVWNLKSQSLAVSLNVSKGKDSEARVTAIAWHPVIATQLAVALDGKDLGIQIWDLKRSMTPLREMRGHEGAVTGLAWNPEDASMMASCGADGKTIWWDPTTGEQSGALQPECGYMIDVQWSPVLPAVLATSSFEPLLCVSTAEDASAAAAAGAPVPKWLKKPCCASISFGGFVASLVPGSNATIGLTLISQKRELSPAASEDVAFKEALQRFPRGSAERAEWLKSQNYNLLAAATACKEDRTPILAYLNEDMVHNDENEDPFETMQVSQKSLEDTAASHIAAGRISEAVEVCLDDGRFDDAFAIAYLQGGKLLQRVHQAYTSYTLKQRREKRHVVYAAAIASGNFALLTEGENAPWKEALSVIISFVGDGFSEACDKLGTALREKGNKEGAMTCYVCSGNLDGVMQLWREDKISLRKMMRDAFLLEEVTGRQMTSTYFADCLYEYGMNLVDDGLMTEAMSIFQRSAGIGNHRAAVMADRLRFEVPVGQVVFPFAMMPLSDSPSPSCIAFFTAKQQQQQQQQQQQPHQQAHQQVQQQRQHRNYLAPAQPSMPGNMQPPAQEQQGSLPTQNFHAQQQPPPPGMQGGMGTVHSAMPAMPPSATPSASPLRLMSHPVSSYSSVRQEASASPLPASSSVSEIRSNGISSAPLRQQPHYPGQGDYGAPQQSYVDPNRPLPPPALPAASRGPAMPAAPPPGGPLPPARGQTPMAPQNSVGAMLSSPPPPPPSGASLPFPQPSGSHLARPMPVSNNSLSNTLRHTGVENNTLGSHVPSQGAASSLYNNQVPPPQLAPALLQSAAEGPSSLSSSRPPMPMSNNLPGVLASKESSSNTSQMNTHGAGNLPPQTSLMPSNIALQPSNAASRPVVAAQTSSAYGASSNAQGSYPSTPYTGGGVSSAMPSRGLPGMPFPVPGAVDDGGLSLFDIASLSPEHQGLAQKLCASIQQVSSVQRRSAVSKAAVELFKMLQRGSLSAEVIALISNYVNAAGTPAAKNEWRRLSNVHFDTIQPFLNLKFL